MSVGGARARRRRYHEWCALRCLKHRDAIVRLVDEHRRTEVAACVAASIALFEMGARSSFEVGVERVVFRLGIIAARMGLLPGVPDISVGPFQIRPSAAFGWRRARVLFGHVATPDRSTDQGGLERCSELLAASTAILLLMELLTQPQGHPGRCDSLPTLYSRYRGRGFHGLQTDRAVLALVHDALHSDESRPVTTDRICGSATHAP